MPQQVTKIRLKKGNKANMPAALAISELVLAIDTGELYFGNAAAASAPIKIMSANIIDKGLTDGVAELDSNRLILDARIPANVARADGIEKTNLNAEMWNGGKRIHAITAPGGLDGEDGDMHFQYD